MAINEVINTPVESKIYASRSLLSHNMQSRSNCVRQADGTLWVVLPVAPGYMHLFRSTDNGFSWDRVFDDVSTVSDLKTTTADNWTGPMVYLAIDEVYDRLDVIFTEYISIGTTYDVQRVRYQLSDLTQTPANTTLLSSIFQGSYSFCHNFDDGFISYSLNNELRIRKVSPRSTSVSSSVDLTDTAIFNMFASCCNEDGDVFHLYGAQIGGVNYIRSAIFSSSAGSWSTPVTIENTTGTDREVKDPVIKVDGYGTLCAAWSDHDTVATTTAVKYVISTNSGATWSAVQSVARASGYGQYNDAVITEEASLVDLIGGADGGFILSYVDDATDGTPTTFVRRLQTTDGSTYTLDAASAARPIGTKYTNRSITGAKFFVPTDTKLMDLRDPGLVRMAYRVDEGEDNAGLDDTDPVIIGQELLSEVAYPSQLDTDSGTYALDTATSTQLLVSFNIVGSAQDNVDFYSLGMTGKQTTKYVAGFNKIGTNIRLLRHEPDKGNYMNDRSAYNAPTETRTLAIFQPSSYSFPSPAVDATGLDAWMERDVRKLYLPPSIHLARTFVVNEGGYLKRTVWLAEFDGNRYELSQVVPHFISNQICYYEVNAYVVGPSRDPFARDVLPSET